LIPQALLYGSEGEISIGREALLRGKVGERKPKREGEEEL